MCSRTLWGSPMNSPVRLGVSPAIASTPTSVFSQRFCDFISPQLNLGLRGLSRSPVVPPSLSSRKYGTKSSASHRGAWSSSCHLAGIPFYHGCSPTGLDECFFFNFLVVRHPYSSIFCQFWLFFVFKFVVLLVVV